MWRILTTQYRVVGKNYMRYVVEHQILPAMLSTCQFLSLLLISMTLSSGSHPTPTAPLFFYQPRLLVFSFFNYSLNINISYPSYIRDGKQVILIFFLYWSLPESTCIWKDSEAASGFSEKECRHLHGQKGGNSRPCATSLPSLLSLFFLVVSLRHVASLCAETFKFLHLTKILLLRGSLYSSSLQIAPLSISLAPQTHEQD